MTPALELAGVSRRFPAAGGQVLHALTDVSLALQPGEVVGLVGESGSGKSTLGLIATRLLQPSAGRVRLDGEDITDASERTLRPLRARLQIVFQDPWSALNPRIDGPARPGGHVPPALRLEQPRPPVGG